VTVDTAGGLDAEPGAQLGTRLREARLRAGLSLRELARQLNVSPSFVSQLENGKSQPSVATLYSLAQLLDLSIDGLFDAHAAQRQPRPAGEAASAAPLSRHPRNALGDTVADAEPISRSQLGSPADAWPEDEPVNRLSVTNPGERSRLVMDSGVIWEQLARNDDQNIDFIEIIYPAGSSSTNDGRMLRHDGYEYGILLEGELEVTFGFKVFTMRAGQGLGLDSSVPHLFKNRGTVAARGIWFVHHRH
jgi:transcriptional regulator with XRE-family HTH domain